MMFNYLRMASSKFSTPKGWKKRGGKVPCGNNRFYFKYIWNLIKLVHGYLRFEN